MKEKHKIGEAELEVMKIVWRGGTVSSTDIVRQLKQQFAWEDTTIYTMIGKLVKKGFLKRQKQTVSYYSATLSARDYRLDQTDRLVEKLFGGDARRLVSMLVENQKISAKDIEALRQYWEEDEDA